MTFFSPPLEASFDDPLAMLNACHDRVRHYATLAPKLAQHLLDSGNDASARDAAQRIVRYFDVAAPLHHADEEEQLFPALLRHAPQAQLELTIAQLQNEHPQLELLWAALRGQLLAVQDGSCELDLALCQEFARRYQEHAALEERALFAPAATLLDAATLQELGRLMAARRHSGGER